MAVPLLSVTVGAAAVTFVCLLLRELWPKGAERLFGPGFDFAIAVLLTITLFAVVELIGVVTP